MKVGHVWVVIFSLEGEESLKEMILELILGAHGGKGYFKQETLTIAGLSDMEAH